MEKVAIKGDGTTERVRRIVEYFEEDYSDCLAKDGYFYEDFDGDLCTCSEMPIGYTLIDLPEEKTKPKNDFCGTDFGKIKSIYWPKLDETAKPSCLMIVEQAINTALKAIEVKKNMNKVAEIITENKSLKAENDVLKKENESLKKENDGLKFKYRKARHAFSILKGIDFNL